MRSYSQRECACGRDYDAERWAALPLFTRLTADEVSLIATPWPPHLVVEVRVCGCKRRMSRLIDVVEQVTASKRGALAA